MLRGPRSISQGFKRFYHPAKAQGLADEPLRILFCGGDVFGIPSLRALHDEAQSGDSNIASIDVITKKDKPTGRGLKTVFTPPMTAVANELGLPVHRIDTFTGWSPPEYGSDRQPYINLIIAVSFGLKIPPRILNHCAYGGLNLHPSMLPQLRGAAPIQWSIIKGLTQTGVSVQTLHPTQFDAGVVLAQTPSPGVSIPNPMTTGYSELRDFLAPIGAELLVKAIRARLYKSPYVDVTKQDAGQLKVTFAPKVRSDMKEIDFDIMDIHGILRRNRAIPRLWAVAETNSEDSKSIRVIFGTDMHLKKKSDLDTDIRDVIGLIPPGRPYSIVKEGEEIHSSAAPIFINTIYGHILSVPTIVLAGSPLQPAALAAAKGHLFGSPRSIAGHSVYVFYKQFRKVMRD